MMLRATADGMILLRKLRFPLELDSFECFGTSSWEELDILLYLLGINAYFRLGHCILPPIHTSI